MMAVHHLEVLKIRNFIGHWGSDGQYKSSILILPNYVAICQNVADIRQFIKFLKWRPSTILDFLRVGPSIKLIWSSFLVVPNLVGIDAVVSVIYASSNIL